MKKFLSVTLAAALLAATAAGCGIGSDTDTTTKAADAETTAAEETDAAEDETTESEAAELSGKITIWCWTSYDYVIDAYCAEHPDVEIEEVIVDAGDYMTKLTTTIASGGELPDIVWGEILNRGSLYALDICDDLTQEPYNLDTGIFVDGIVNTMKNESGEVVGIESAVSPAGLAYHRNLTQEYFGVSEPEDVQALFSDWDSLIEACKKVKEESGVYAFTSLGDLYYIMTGQAEEARVTDGTIHRQAVVDLFTNICKFRDAGIVSQVEQWTPAWYASFGTSDAIFSPMPSYGIENFIAPAYENAADSDWGLIIPPDGGFLWGGNALSVTKTSENKELAFDFIMYLCCGDGAKLRIEKGDTPAVTSLYSDEVLNAENEYFGGQQVMKTFMEDILPTTTSVIPTEYDYTDVCTMETVLSALNADYNMTAEEAADLYIQEMQNQLPDLTVD